MKFLKEKPFYSKSETEIFKGDKLDIPLPEIIDESNENIENFADHRETETNSTDQSTKTEPEQSIERYAYRRSNRMRRKMTHLQDYYTYNVTQLQENISTRHYNLLSHIYLNHEPGNYEEAKDIKQWVDAMEEELQALKSNDTWDVTELPKGKKAVGCWWTYKIN